MTDMFADDDPITLDEAARLFMRGLVTSATLRAEAERGRSLPPRSLRREPDPAIIALVESLAVLAAREDHRAATKGGDACPKPPSMPVSRPTSKANGQSKTS